MQRWPLGAVGLAAVPVQLVANSASSDLWTFDEGRALASGMLNEIGATMVASADVPEALKTPVSVLPEGRVSVKPVWPSAPLAPLHTYCVPLAEVSLKPPSAPWAPGTSAPPVPPRP